MHLSYKYLFLFGGAFTIKQKNCSQILSMMKRGEYPVREKYSS